MSFYFSISLKIQIEISYFGAADLLMVKFMARLAKLESKSPVKTLLLGPGAGLTAVAWGPTVTPPVTPDGCNRSPKASKPKTNRQTHTQTDTSETKMNE
jgi:hypothetical protein